MITDEIEEIRLEAEMEDAAMRAEDAEEEFSRQVAEYEKGICPVCDETLDMCFCIRATKGE
jgi:hypothetical protein